MTLLIDNYDSFSYNLYQIIGSIGSVRSSEPSIKIVRNDEISIEEIKTLAPDRIVISPGPGKPSDAGMCIEIVKKLYNAIPILGICLGHQAIFEAFGGSVSYAERLMHGKSSEVTIDTRNALFKRLPSVIQAARYHSLTGLKKTLPETLDITAWTDDGEIMAVCHKKYPVYGVQFHPESILTPQGDVIIENFIGGH
ncbi:MAG: aminodeoxychorismate/anthranilate synthase component II [Oscillospiraceae bacterium]|nr:aminodeoxychorismate/anthranilate synthase component II [Oscillospiraceae bacterium]